MTDYKLLACLAVVALSGVATAANRPNLLILLADDLREDALSCYNPECPITTSHIDKLAEDGVRFENGSVTTPICVVSRASILTGRYECNARQHQFLIPMPDDVFEQSYPLVLREAGYFTGQLGKYGVGIRPAQKKRFDVFEAQAAQGPAFRNYKGRRMHDAEWLTVKTEEFLDRAPKDRPFCLQVNYKEPHNSSQPALEDDELLATRSFARSPHDTPVEFAKLPQHVQTGFGHVCYHKDFNVNGDHNPYLRQYHEKIVSVDRSVGRILKLLEERGLLGNTVVLFLSDHGTHFGEKQLAGKWTPYEQSLRIPFIVFDPRLKTPEGVVRQEMVLNIDVAPTLLDLAGVPIPDVMDGRSVAPLMFDKRVDWRDHSFFEHFCSPAPIRYIPRNVGVRTTSTKYVRWIDVEPAVEEFFDLASDPMETRDLSKLPQYQEQLKSVRQQFDQWRTNNPSTFEYDSYGPRPQFGAKEVNWKRFQEVRPKEYAKIKSAIERLGVTWEQAVTDWEVRYEVCSRAGYWY